MSIPAEYGPFIVGILYTAFAWGWLKWTDHKTKDESDGE